MIIDNFKTGDEYDEAFWIQNPKGLGSKVKSKIIVSTHVLINHSTFLLLFFFST